VTSRLAKKRAAVWTAEVLSIPLALDHARPSFFRLDRKAQRHALRWCIRKRLGVSKRVASEATRRWAAGRSSVLYLTY